MAPVDELQLIAALATARSACDAALVALTTQHSENQAPAPVVAAAPGPAETDCPHNDREDIRTFGGEHWICRTCGYEFRR